MSLRAHRRSKYCEYGLSNGPWRIPHSASPQSRSQRTVIHDNSALASVTNPQPSPRVRDEITSSVAPCMVLRRAPNGSESFRACWAPAGQWFGSRPHVMTARSARVLRWSAKSVALRAYSPRDWIRVQPAGHFGADCPMLLPWCAHVAYRHAGRAARRPREFG
jgi:hypothetical protein